MANRGDGQHALVVHFECGAGRGRACDEQLDGLRGNELAAAVVGDHVVDVNDARSRGKGERRHRVEVLAVDIELLSGGGDNGDPGTGGQERGDELGGRLDDVLAVVDDEENLR